jgi:hypothetical protein
MGARRLFLVMTLLALAGATEASARGSHGGSHSRAHGHRHGAARPANPSVPASLTSNPRVTGTAPLPPHHQPRRGSAPAVSEKRDPEDIVLDRKIKSICRGC